MNKEKIRQRFRELYGINWLNSQGEPDIDYVEFLEEVLLRYIKEQTEQKADSSEIICSKPTNP